MWQANAQYTFPTVPGPVNVVAGTGATVNLNDAANSAGVPVALYDSFSITVDWGNPAGNPWSSEAELQVVTINGVVADIDPPSTGAANSGAATTLTFSGTITGNYEPGVDGTLDIVFGQSYTGSSADWSNIVVELFEVPSCEEPTALMLDSVTTTEAVVSWTNDPGATLGVEFEFGASGFAPGTGASIAAGGGLGSSATSGTTLSPNTDYDFYVRSNCDANGFSTWAGPVSFTTLCAAITPDYTADMSVNVPDSCWDEAGNGEVVDGPMDLGASLWRQGTSYAFGPSNAINLYTTGFREWLLSPTFDLSVGGPYQLEVNVAVTNWNNGTQDDTMGSDDEVQLLMSTDGGASWMNMTTWNVGNEPPVGGIEYVEDLTAITGNVQFAIFASDGTVNDLEDYDFHVGKFRVREIPACPDPASVMMTSLTDMTADFSWSMGGTETTWQYANLPSPSVEPGSGTSTMSTSVGFTGLTPETDYDFYVRSDCGGTFSSWVMVSYTTPATPPANDDCVNAIALTPGGVYNDNPVDGSLIGATDSGFTNSCGGTAVNDVWYTVVVPAGGDITIETAADIATGTTGNDTAIEVYTSDSDCTGTLTSIGCDDDGAATGAYSFLELTSLTPGATLYIRVWGFGDDEFEPYSISAFSATLSTGSFENEAAFTYYPNPVQNTLTLNAQNTIENVAMYNMLGQEVLRATPNAVNSELDMSSLQDGTYFVKVTIDNNTKTIRIIKK